METRDALQPVGKPTGLSADSQVLDLAEVAERVGLLRPSWPQAFGPTLRVVQKLLPATFVEPSGFVHPTPLRSMSSIKMGTEAAPIFMSFRTDRLQIIPAV